MPKKARAATELLATKYPKQHAAYLDMQSRANSRGKEALRQERPVWRETVQRRRRLAELQALIERRYGVAGVDDENKHGHVDIVELARHALAAAKPVEMVESAVKFWCRQCSLRTIATILRAAQAWKPLHAAHVGKRVMLTTAERQALAITTMTAADETPGQAAKRQRARKRRNRDALRRRRGAQTRDEYAWASQTCPWQAFGISRRTWERRGKQSPHVLHGGRDASASPGRPEGSGMGGDTLASAVGGHDAAMDIRRDVRCGFRQAHSQVSGVHRQAHAQVSGVHADKAPRVKGAPSATAIAHSGGRAAAPSTRAAVRVKRHPLRGHPGGVTTAPVLTHDTKTWGTA
jgi:hypothetical protein